MSRDMNWLGGGHVCLFLYFTCKREHSINWISILRNGAGAVRGTPVFPHHILVLFLRSNGGGGHSQCWGNAGAAPSLSGPLHHTALHQGQSHLFIHSSRGSPAPPPPHAAPFYSQGRVTLAAISQAWEEPTRSTRKPQLALLCTTVKELLCGTAPSIHQGWFWGFNRWKENFQAYTSFYLVKHGVMWRKCPRPCSEEAAGSEEQHPVGRGEVEGDALIGRNEEHGATVQGHLGGCGCGGAHGCPLDHQQDAGRVHGRDEVQLDGGRDLPRKMSLWLEPPSALLLSGELERRCPHSHPFAVPAAAQAQGPLLSEDTQDLSLVLSLLRTAGEGEQAPRQREQGRDKETSSTSLCASIPPSLPGH